MADKKHSDGSDVNTMGAKKTLLISLIILMASGAVIALIFMTEPKAVRGGAVKETAMLVDVIRAEYGTFRPVISSTGIVKPSQDIILRPQVGGLIISISGEFTPGGFVKKGEILLKIDPSDYKNRLRQMESELRQAIADLNIEMGRQNVALKDYQLLAETLSKENEALVLRQPQINASRASVEAARAAVNQAELELERTVIKAPFDAHIVNRSVNSGSLVSPGETLAHLVGIDTYWVETSVPLAKLRWLDLPGKNVRAGSDVRIRNRSAWRKDEFRMGYIFKLVGTLEEGTRLARVLVSVQDPLARSKGSEGLPELMIGSFLETNIQGKEVSEVIRLNREYVRKKDTVWVHENGKLRIREVEIILKDELYAYITNGLNKDELVVTTNLSTVVDGAGLRIESGNTPEIVSPVNGDKKKKMQDASSSERP